MSARRLIAAAALILLGLGLPRPCASQTARVPLEPGLTLSYVASLTGEPDYESILYVEKADSDALQLRMSWNRGDRKWRFFRRPLSRRERQRAHSFYDYGLQGDTSAHRGYALSMATSVVLAELKRDGRSEVAVLLPEITPRAPYRGVLERVGNGPEAFSVLLDGRRVSVPGIRAKGVLENLSASERRLTMEFVFLDDAEAPWYLDSRVYAANGRGGHHRLVRIGTSKAQEQLAAALRTQCEAHISDIFFATGSADVDSASVPTFQRIAAVLAANPGWQVTVVGHTDSIGDDAANLALSRRRAEAARTILLRDFHVAASRLSADGRGEREPLEDNATPQGRARNRRVDLKRRCD